ncbi:MAG: hypothetical protein IT581_21055 [Verrucomicrobiales bacterium]|nr:hypothetical protein [Verrucomicrobiales bacterium]
MKSWICSHLGQHQVFFGPAKILLLLQFTSTASVVAAGAPNDFFDDRTAIRGADIIVTASSVGANREASEPNHAGQNGGASLWWLWRPTEEGYAVVDTQGSTFDTLLGVYFGKEMRSLSVIASSDDDGPGSWSRLGFDADLQHDYAIAVDGKGGATGEARLHLKLYTLPEILAPPVNLDVTDGENAVFTVDALGKRPLSFQWQRFGTNLANETQATLTVPAATKALAGAYRVIVGNSYGTVTSVPPAILRVLERPKIAQHPRDAQKEDGDDVTFTVRAFGEPPLAYAWEFKPTGLANYQIVPGGGDAPDLKLANLGTDQAGFYRARVSNAFGEAVSEPARLTVIADRPRILEALTNQTVVEVTNVLFTAKVRGQKPLQFRWFKDGAAIPGADGPEYLIDRARTNASGIYRFSVWNRYGTNTSQEARLVVEPRPPNDHLTNRIDVSFRTNVIYGFNKNGTRETSEPAHVGQAATHSVWWSYAATNRGVLTVDLAESTIDTLLSVYRGTNFATLVRIVDNDNAVDLLTGQARVQSLASFVVEPGEEYVIAVDGKNGQEADWTGNGGRGGLGLKVRFSPDFGAPFFLGDLQPFLLLFGDFGGGCRNVDLQLAADSLVPFGYRWQYNLRCPTPEDLLSNAGGTRIPAELPDLLSSVTQNWLGGACSDTDLWVDIPGATNSTLSLTNLSVQHSGLYRLVAQNNGVSGSVTSAPTHLVVSPVPSVLMDLPTRLDAKDCEQRELEFRADGGCNPMSLEWHFGGVKIPGATNATYVFTNGSPARNGRYFAVARGPYGAATSAVCQVTFDATPLIRTQPRGLSEPAKDCDQLILTTEVVESCRPTRFQWLLNGREVPGATNASLSFRATAETAGDYRVKAFNEFASTLSEIAKVPVDARPFIEEHPESAKPRRILAGNSFTNIVRVQSCSDLTFEWRRNGVPVALDTRVVSTQSITDPVRSIVTCQLVTRNAAPGDSGRYDVVVRSRSGSVTSRSEELTVLFRPPNDDFANRFPLRSVAEVDQHTNVFAGSTQGTNILATAELDEPEHARQPARHSIWWTWTAPAPCEVTLDTVGSDFDTLLSVYRGDSLTNLVRVIDDDQSTGGNASKAAFLAARGRILHFAVDGSGGAEGFVKLQLRAREIVSPPIILDQPRSLAATNNATATFSVGAYGSPDILYQWAFNAVPIPGATNDSLTITNVQPRHEGNYTVRLRNEFGETNSLIARLTFGIIIVGQVTDATHRRGVPGATVSVGTVSTITDTNGNYSLVGVRPGEANADFDARKRVVRLQEPVRFDNRTTLQTLHLHADKQPEYFDYDDFQFEAKLGQTVTNTFSMSPVFTGLRFVVNWGLDPADLDAHLLTPPISGTTYHVQYPQANRGSRDSPPFATLDFDVQDSYGPETLTAYRLEDGVYRFFVKKFDPGARGDLTASKATVKVYTRGGIFGTDGLYGTRSVPLTGDGSVWHVCDIDGRRRAITWIDQLLPGDPPPVLPPTLAASSATPDSLPQRKTAAPASPPTQPYPGVRFAWDFGDGASSAEVEPVHAYRAPGLYTVKLALFRVSPANQRLDEEVKTNFITVYNEEPTAKLVAPLDGKLFKLGDLIPVEAEAFDFDGEVRRVEFLRVSAGRTNVIASDLQPPYQFTFIADEPGPVTLLARAIDDFDAAGLSAPVRLRVLDLAGDVLIVRNSVHPEIDQMVEWLDSIKVPTEDGFSRDLVVRVLDQEGLYLELIQGFKLVIWDDLGETRDGLTDADAALFQQAYDAGIALYLMGDRLASASYNLGAELGTWTSLTHLRPPLGLEVPGLIQPIVERPRHELFGQRYGEVGPMNYPGPESEKWDLADAGADVVATMAGRPIMLRHPPFEEPDFGAPRRVVQGFRVANGTDEESRDERRKLFLNTSAWLLRLTDCRNFGGFLSCVDSPPGAQVGEPLTFEIQVTQNGECTVGGVVITNRLAPTLELQSYEILATSGRANTNNVRSERDGNAVIWRLGQLPSAGSFLIRITAIPRRGGLVTNLHSLTFGVLSRPPCVQSFVVGGAACDVPARLTGETTLNDQVTLTISGPPGCGGWIESSAELLRWEPFQPYAADGTGTARVLVGSPPGTHRFFRVRAD